MPKFDQYKKTVNFEIIDTIGVPHTFCITERHVSHAHNNFSGQLNEAAIESLEKIKGHSCGVRGCQLRFSDHKQALVVKCKIKDEKLLKEYLESNLEQCQKDKYKGFVLLDGTN